MPRPTTKTALLAASEADFGALVAPDVVVLDRWGYPVVPEGPLRAGDVAAARRAVVSCPRKALWVEEHARDERAVRPGADAVGSTRS